MCRQASVQGGEIEITPEIMAAGVRVLEWWETDGYEEWDSRVLARAMYTASETSCMLARNQKS